MNQKIIELINKQGWIELKNITSDEELITLAQSIGQIIKHPNGELIGSLKPKSGKDSIKGTFSNQYGYNSFPLHTDTAFWGKPARYILLSSKEISNCSTLIVSSSDIWENISDDDMKFAKQAIYLIKTIHGQFYSSLIFRENNIEGLRYDSTCMRPFNQSGKKIQESLELILSNIQPKKIDWTGNKTIIIDNWKILHGRTPIINNKNRELKRIYIQSL